MARTLIVLAASAVVVFAPPAHSRARTEVHPYIALDQTVFGDLKNGGGAQAYTTLSAGVDASVQTNRAEGQISYRYEYRFGWDGQPDSQVHSGLARGRYQLVPNLLGIEGGALATRTRADIGGASPLLGVGTPSNIAQVYSAYAGPTLLTRVNDFDVSAFYRFGYTKSEIQSRGLIAGIPVVDSFDSSTTHQLGGSVGMRSGAVLPFGWTVSAGYTRDDARQLDQRYEAKLLRGDIVQPVSSTLALTAGIGYEKIEASQRDPLRDAAGLPILDSRGRYITDPSSPRLLGYDTDGLIWDVGVIWRPSRRTQLQAKIGHRYDDVTYTGDFSWQIDNEMALRVGIYDGIQSFGRQIVDALSRVPTQFVVLPETLGGQYNGCVFGAAGGDAGTCLSPALSSVASGVYRSRGVFGLWRYQRGPWAAGIAAGYDRRRFFAPRTAGFGINGIVDQYWYAQGNVSRKLTDHSGADAGIYVNWSNSGLANSAGVLGTGASASYYHSFGDRLTGGATLGLGSTKIEGIEASLTGAAQVGVRYGF